MIRNTLGKEIGNERGELGEEDGSAEASSENIFERLVRAERE